MKYFAYGMNTNLDQMASRCPGAVCLGAAWIDDYEFVFRTHADIAQSPGGICYGVLWDIDKKHLQSLDALEGYPYYYTRFQVKVNTGDYFVFAMTYQMIDQSYLQRPGSGYLDMVQEGYVQNSVPTNQIDHAINMICSSSTATNTELANTWSPTTQDFVWSVPAIEKSPIT
jgi:gamma-glutamylcyclotransferase (GGCT)/AIG2-like uncharacterized protein YtfP